MVIALKMERRVPNLKEKREIGESKSFGGRGAAGDRSLRRGGATGEIWVGVVRELWE